MLQGIIGIKKEQYQSFDDKGLRIPITVVSSKPCTIVQIKTKDQDGYSAVCLGIEENKKAKKSQIAHFKKIKIEKIPRYLKEIEGDISDKKVGDLISSDEVFKAGDKVDVIGISKGKGFAGVVKRHHFKGGPKTHGQSDRERAPGSIGQTTTPGRVYKGKRMAGRLGGGQVTVKNLEIVKIDQEKNEILIKGLVPGHRNSLLVINKSIKPI